jgi:hypothetical protein
VSSTTKLVCRLESSAPVKLSATVRPGEGRDVHRPLLVAGRGLGVVVRGDRAAAERDGQPVVHRRAGLAGVDVQPEGERRRRALGWQRDGLAQRVGVRAAVAVQPGPVRAGWLVVAAPITPEFAVHGLVPDSKPGLPRTCAAVQAAAIGPVAACAGASAAAGSAADPARTAHPAIAARAALLIRVGMAALRLARHRPRSGR